MKCQAKHIVIILMILLLPIYLISCSGNTSTSLPSEKSSEAPKDRPGMPTDLSAIGADSHVTLTWTPPPVTGENAATSYNLYWSTTSGVTEASNRILNVSMPFTHMDLMNGQTYYYRVCAMNIYGESLLSSEVQATPMLPFTKILTKLTDPDAEQWDEFGWAVAIDGDFAVVGAWRSEVVDSNNIVLQDAGAAYVYIKTNGTWTGGVRLTAPDAQVDDHFGCAVSISGDYIIVGARREDGGPGDPMPQAGAAYIFHRTGVNANTWEAGVKIVGPDPNPVGYFGTAVSISGDYAIVGQPGEGRAYIFHRTDTNIWDSGTIVVWGPDSETGDRFGSSVAISGDYAIVGAPGEDGGAGNPLLDAGGAYIFHRTDVNSWNLASKVMAHDAEPNDNFGSSVAISGDYAVVGACGRNNSAGAAYVFHRLDENFWDEGPKITAPDAQEYDMFGYSVAITDRYLLIGAFAEDCGWDNNDGEGAAYLYERIGANTWDNGTKITIPQGDVGDNFGFSVAISGESAIIGAVGDDCNEENEVPAAGAVYVY